MSPERSAKSVLQHYGLRWKSGQVVEMRTTNVGVEMVKMFEYLKLKAYQDSVGIWTIGYGHTGGVREGDVIDLPTAEQFLREDLYLAEAAVASLKVDIQPWEFDALVSFTFNLGEAALKGSTLCRMIEGGARREAAPQFSRWVYAGGKPLAGLKKRRFAEAVRFLGGDFPMVSMAYHGAAA